MHLEGFDNKTVSFKFFTFLASSLLIAEYPEVVFGGFTFFFRDFGIFSYPNAVYVKDCFLNGELPLWNPLNEFGIPFLAQWNTMVLYPGNFFYILLPPQWSVGVFNLLHLIFGAIGMYVLAYRITKNSIAATIAGVAYQFNGVTLNSLMWTNNIAALGWMPWVIAGVHFMLKSFSLKSLVFAIVLCTIQILTGAPEIIGITWLIVLAIMLSEMIENKLNIYKICSSVIIVFIGTILISLPQLLSFYQLFLNSHRYAIAGDSSWALSSPINIIAPMINTFQWKYGVFFQKEQFWTSSIYINVGVIWLAIVAFIYKRRFLNFILLFLCIIGLVLSMGENTFFYPLIMKMFRVISTIRFPIKFIIIPVFLIPLLASIGFAEMIKTNAKYSKLKRIISFASAAGLVILILFFTFRELSVSGISFLQKKYIFENSIVRCLFLFIFVLMVAGYKHFVKLLLINGLLLFFIIFFDVKTHSPRQNPTVENWVFEKKLLKEDRPSGFSNGRILTYHDKDYKSSSFTGDAVMEMLSKRVGLFSNLNLIEGISKVSGMFSIHIYSTAAIVSKIYEDGISIPTGLADFLSIRWTVNTNRQYEWMERTSPLGLVNVGQNVIFASEVEIWNGVFSPAFNPNEVVFIQDSYKDLIGEIKNNEPNVDSIEINTHKISFRTFSDNTAMVTISQAYYPCWRAKIDGGKTRILKANYGFQALSIPKGRHNVEIYYFDINFISGIVISLCIVVSLFKILKVSKKKRFVFFQKTS